MITLENPLKYSDRPSTAAERNQWANDLVNEIRRLLIRKVKKNGKPRPMTRGDYDRLSLRGPITIQRLWELEQLRDQVIGELNAQTVVLDLTY